MKSDRAVLMMAASVTTTLPSCSSVVMETGLAPVGCSTSISLVEPSGMTVYGNPSAALKKQREGTDPVYMEVIGGFAR